MRVPSAYDWSGFYAGGHVGQAWGTSNWTSTPGIAGSTSLYQSFNGFDGTGSIFAGLQAGYNYMLPNRFLLGAEVDATFPSWPNLAGISIGGTSNLTSPALGVETFSETVLASGTVRGRIGFAPGNWLFYATGGFAWTYDRQTLTQLATGAVEQPFLWRLGFAVGAGVEVPIAPHWTARLEYLFTDYGSQGMTFFGGAQGINSDFKLQELRAGLNYQFGNDSLPANALPMVTKAPATPDIDRVNFHSQTTFLWQGYPAIRSPYEGQFSLPRGGQARETADASLFAGVRLWKGAEAWFDAEIDQGFGLEDTHGAAGFPSGEAYKLGANYPYARLQRYFLRQTIDLGGETQKGEADVTQFAGSQTANRLVLSVGHFSIVDLFDTNRYANNPKTDFMNWALINAGTFDYAGDAWGYSYGAAAEWYQGRFTVRAGVFDLSATPAGGNSPTAFGLDSTSPVSAGRRNRRAAPTVGATRQDQSHRLPQPRPRRTICRRHRARPGDRHARRHHAGAQLHQPPRREPQHGAADHRDPRRVRPRRLVRRQCRAVGFRRYRPGQLSGGVSIAGKQWGRPDDTIGIAGVLNGIAPVHQAFFNAGGLGILIRAWAIAESVTRRDHRSLLQLRADRRDAGFRRLSAHRQSGLQYRSRAGERFPRPLPRPILT